MISSMAASSSGIPRGSPNPPRKPPAEAGPPGMSECGRAPARARAGRTPFAPRASRRAPRAHRRERPQLIGERGHSDREPQSTGAHQRQLHVQALVGRDLLPLEAGWQLDVERLLHGTGARRERRQALLRKATAAGEERAHQPPRLGRHADDGALAPLRVEPGDDAPREGGVEPPEEWLDFTGWPPSAGTSFTPPVPLVLGRSPAFAPRPRSRTSGGSTRKTPGCRTRAHRMSSHS